MGTAKSREPDESGQGRTQRSTCGCLPGTTECHCSSGDPDTLLMSRLAGGDEAAFDPLFRRNADRAYQIARRLLPIPQDAEDVAQEALLQVFASRSRWKPTARFTTWLYRIVVNLSLKRLRKAKTATAFALAAPPPDEEGPAGREAQAPPADEPEQVLLKKELAEAVVQAVNALPPNQRMAVTLLN
jgi:RNA polymerase sigma-70 factor, ECF subfamily